MIYYCKTCGRWQDIRILQHLSTIVDNFAKALRSEAPQERQEPVYLCVCPDGHGPMVLLQPTDLIQLREASPTSRLTLLRQEESESGNQDG